mmetsp:Transcript_79134/g.219962  ORF Transcript_79134/g.219962 Transcript_79134/m.219962 type:complete len:295 (+) Transcript_79134:587-1471(+)
MTSASDQSSGCTPSSNFRVYSIASTIRKHASDKSGLIADTLTSGRLGMPRWHSIWDSIFSHRSTASNMFSPGAGVLLTSSKKASRGSGRISVYITRTSSARALRAISIASLLYRTKLNFVTDTFPHSSRYVYANCFRAKFMADSAESPVPSDTTKIDFASPIRSRSTVQTSSSRTSSLAASCFTTLKKWARSRRHKTAGSSPWTTTDSVQGRLYKRASSPTYAPGPSVVTSNSSWSACKSRFMTFSSPLSTANMAVASPPCSNRDSPALTFTLVMQSSSCCNTSSGNSRSTSKA